MIIYVILLLSMLPNIDNSHTVQKQVSTYHNWIKTHYHDFYIAKSL